MDLPQKAFEQFVEGNLNDSLQSLQKLLSQCSKEDSGKIMSNIAIVEYFIQNCQHPSHLLSKLNEIQEQNFTKQISQNEEEVDFVGGAICAYNRALLQYQLQNYSEAINILEGLHSHLDPLDEFLTLRIYILLLECYILTKDVNQANFILSNIDMMQISIFKESPYEEQMPSLLMANGLKSHGQPPNCHSANEFRFLTLLYKARIALINNNIQEAKNHIKYIPEIKASYALKLQPQIESLTVAMTQYMKSKIALQKNKFCKAIQILNKCQDQTSYILDNQTHATCKPSKTQKLSMPIFHYNNLGCIHIQLEKYSLAQMYLKEAINYCQISEEDVKIENIPVHSVTYYTYMRKYQVLYNYAITLLKLGEAEQSLQYFIEIKDYFKNEYMIWYRIAQCTVIIHHKKQAKQTQPNDCYEEQRNNIIVLPQRSNNKRVKCIRHALSLIEEQIVRYSLQYNALQSQEQEVQQQNTIYFQEVNSHLQYYYSKKVDCLLLLSFICLCKNDEPHCALQASTEVLNMQQYQITQQQKYIATMYMVEALCIIGNNQKALEHIIKLDTSEDFKVSCRTTCFPNCCKIFGQVNKQFGFMKYALENEISNKMILYLNQASAYLMNDNFQVAWIYLQNALGLIGNQASQHNSQTQQGIQYQQQESFPAPLLSLLIYANLKQGNTKNALMLLKQRKYVNFTAPKRS